MIDFTNVLPAIIEDTSDDFHARDPETFFASQIGFCRRQLYLAKLGLRDTTAAQGQFRAGTLVQEYFGEQLGNRYPQLELEAKTTIDAGAVTLVGRCDWYDPDTEIVYDLKSRSNWYRFHPPVDRHLDQLQVYMRGLDAQRGQIIYVSKADLADVRSWPPTSADADLVHFDPERFEQLVAKAIDIRDEILVNGIATTPEEIPYEPCECFLCETETLQLPELGRHVRQGDPHPDNSDSLRRELPMGGEQENEAAIAESQPGAKADTGEPRPGPSPGNSAELTNEDAQVLESDTRHVPAGLIDFDIWVVWDGREKFARAPWQTDTMYPCEWAADKPVDPCRSYEKAKMVADLPVSEIHATWPFPDGDDLPDQVEPAVLLPHDPPDPPIVFVDFDDVRDLESGRVSGEAVGLISLLDGYTELSRSGRGLHVYVRGELPERMGRFEAPLPGTGHIEIYDHSRFTGGTWRHVEGTPMDAIPEAQAAIDEIIDRYGTDSRRTNRTPSTAR